MNGKTIKKIRKEINTSFDEREKQITEQIFSYFNSLSFSGRLKIAWKIICKKL